MMITPAEVVTYSYRSAWFVGRILPAHGETLVDSLIFAQRTLHPVGGKNPCVVVPVRASWILFRQVINVVLPDAFAFVFTVKLTPGLILTMYPAKFAKFAAALMGIPTTSSVVAVVVTTALPLVVVPVTVAARCPKYLPRVSVASVAVPDIQRAPA
jgi:hypothetical protein